MGTEIGQVIHLARVKMGRLLGQVERRSKESTLGGG